MKKKRSSDFIYLKKDIESQIESKTIFEFEKLITSFFSREENIKFYQILKIKHFCRKATQRTKYIIINILIYNNK